MPTLSPLKKTLLASAFIAPLVLGACSSGSEESTEAQDVAATATTEVVAAKQGDTVDGDKADSKDVEVEGGAAVEGDVTPTDATDGEDIDPAAGVVDPLSGNQLTFEKLAPVEGGQPADEADRAEIESLITGMYDAETLHDILGYLPANTCHEVIQEAGGPAAFDLANVPDLPLSAVPEYANSNPGVDAVEDVQVDGGTASASVTVTSDGQSQTEVQRFRHEDGVWKFCN
ncbi:hypothetical protein [Corynebacterium halotolerans]|uniref:Rv0361 family membrane protein n=1 Tax=Corynebacterium halotolerans TaxID=225326 RepID=UPI003CF8CD54